MTGGAGPLAGVTVVDLTRMLTDGTATQHLADLGVRVVKIEQGPHGDETPRPIPRVGEHSSAHHQYLDRNKEFAFLDLKDDEGGAAALDLIAASDAVVECFRPAWPGASGSATTMLWPSPNAAYVSPSGYGQDGPWALRRSRRQFRRIRSRTPPPRGRDG